MKFHHKNLVIRAFIACTAFAFTLTGCTNSKDSKKAPSIAVFIPGIMADSPTYAHVAEGVQQAVDDYNAPIQDQSKKAQLYIMEAGTNQSEWSTKLTALTATGKYDVIISSNPSLPEIAEPLTHQFPNQKYIFLDAHLENNKSIYTVSYNQRDQAYLSGYIAGLYSKSHKIALVAAQEYPIMNTILYPYYAKGAADAIKDTTCDFRIVGNWYDAAKGAEITDALVSTGVDVILPICGGASQGVIS
ncbi:MAG: BMP family ABC transporter substrate-binding protein, partial [Treponema sp.]|nr:BMP family ABC transporter substrate-binding protein [Treponema sp.]